MTDAELAGWALTPEEQAVLHPYFRPAGFAAFEGFAKRPPDYRLLYADTAFRKALAENPHAYPNLKAHLDRVACVNTSAFAPSGLHRPRQPEWFTGPRLLCPRQVPHPSLAWVSKAACVNEGFYILKPDPADGPWMTALLNSTLAWFWFYHHKRKGQQLQIDKDVLAPFPAPPTCTPELRKQLTRLHNNWGAGDPDQNQQALDVLIAKAYGLEASTQRMLSDWRHGMTGV